MAQDGGGFRNIKPLSRAERRSQHDKVALEKDRLMKRTGYEAKMYRENAPTSAMGLLVPETDAAGFLSDADRFHTDTSGEEFLARKMKYESKQASYAQKRVDRVEREEERWDVIQARKKEEEAYWDEQRSLGEKARKNHSSVPYDTLTLRYNDGLDGERLRFDDDKVRYRAAARSRNLQRCGDTRAGYNIINGHERGALSVPDQPQPPAVLANHLDAVQAAAAADRARAYSNMGVGR
ncbi:hypothetical protein M885DRAFT_546770 [Pelagophyceae sp. CCMP2097]|nr:hypothetical protein M885DRAFT_546770 [Pelagophyceae sp. CCMP2097]|mmetsp:Transcript_20213/g.68467  ORF Transcript_20213/g.68467 Transcript_20213/m.68467 type:complete len:237 (-) Transcript_20213:30-740(-)